MRARILEFVKKETVLCIAASLALLSCFTAPPDLKYLSYIDFRVLALLFSLMLVVAGFQKQGTFERMGHALLKNIKTTRQLSFCLVFLCFFASMAITNDVALITFVPFSVMILSMAGLEESMVRIIVLQTIAANLGSMLTPIGNPQNLYLFSAYGMSFAEFMRTTVPVTLASALLLILVICMSGSKELEVDLPKKRPEAENAGYNSAGRWLYPLLLVLCLACVARVVPYQAALAVVVLAVLLFERTLFFRVDYGLLLTFVCFFIFIGNMGRMPAVSRLLEQLLDGNELLAAAGFSQFISNVPAAILLSGFTDNGSALLLGVNIGGLGTLIASLASLISYKYYAGTGNANMKKFMGEFTGWNLAFLAVLMLFVILFPGGFGKRP